MQRKTLKEVTNLSNGIFSAFSTAHIDVPWGNTVLPSLTDLMYYTGHSGEKYISPLVKALLGNNEQLTNDNMLTLAHAAWNLYKYKWNTLYSTLSFTYNPIENYNMTEYEEMQSSKSVTNEGSDSSSRQTVTGTTASKDVTDTLTKSGSEAITKGGSEAHTIDEDTTGSVSDTQNIYGFNSAEAVPSGSGSGTSGGTKDVTDTLTFTNRTDTTSFTDRSDSRVIDEDDSSSVTTAEGIASTNSNTVGEEAEAGTLLTRSGNIGTVTAQDMILQEREVALFNFFEAVFKDLDKLLTIDTYY